MATRPGPHTSMLQYDYILDKPTKRLQLVKETLDDGGQSVPMAVDSYLSSVVEAYEMVGEMSSSDKQQVSMRIASVKEKSVECNHDMVGGSFDGAKWKHVCTSVLDALIKAVEESRKAQMLRQLQLCEHNLDGMLKCGYIEIIITEYKRLLTNTARLFDYISKYLSWGTLRGKSVVNVLLLCASQLQKLFPLLLQALDITDCTTELCDEVKNYIAGRMKFCILRVRKGIEGEVLDEMADCDDLGGGLFMSHMDQALTYLAVFDGSKEGAILCDQWHSCVEAVLQHAMSIAQIASQFDFKMIHASGEKVLRECQILDHEYKSASRNPSFCSLHATTLSHALEELEQRVCASVLKMHLQVFSDPFTPLQALCTHCHQKETPQETRKADDLSEIISDFDAHTDRILQVAVFAIACSEDQNRILSIRSCLASLESLEAHLVPSLTNLYLKQGASRNLLAWLLVEHWTHEVKLLWQHIDGIIDPAALAQVTHDVIWAPTAVLKKSIIMNKALGRHEILKIVKSVVSNVEVLSNQLQVCAEEMGFSEHPAVCQALKELLQAVREGRAVIQKIEAPAFNLSVDRILKRCELLVTCVEHIQPLLEELDSRESKSSLSHTENFEASIDPENESMTSKISPGKHRSLRKKLLSMGLPADAEIEIDTADASGSPDLMQSFMDKTQAQPRFMTSFLYNGKRNISQQFVNTAQHNHGSHIFSRRVVENQDDLLQRTFSLNVHKLASRPETLRCSNRAITKFASPLCQKLQVLEGECDEEDSLKDISTPERMGDLLTVQNKIDAVKFSSKYYD